jgi:endothelin-converting enzyme/putative endopeptidase
MRAMRRLLPLSLTLVALTACSSEPAPAPKGPAAPTATPASSAPDVAAAPMRPSVELGDMNTKVDPCTDFYEYANGTWRAQNPIPASMDRWSRRWKAGEVNKERLSGILEEISKRTDWPAKSVEQQVGDFYASCMDEKSVDAAGVTPIKPLLAEFDAMKSAKDVQRMIRRLHELAVPVPFALESQPDAHDPRRVIANVAASGLGMPDRDYYFKTEPRFAEARDRYRAHVAKVFTLLGKKDADARKAADTVVAIETRLADRSLDNVARRDPKKLDHPTPFDGLAKTAPHVDWAAYFDEAKLPRGDLNVEEPDFLAAVDKEVASTKVAEWRTYLTWQLALSAAPWLSKPLSDEWFDFHRRFLFGVAEMKPRSTRCAELTDRLLGEALGQKYVERYFPPAAKARAQELVQNELAAMKEIIASRPWMSDATKKKALEKLSTFNPKIGYPDKWKDYSSVDIRRASLWANVVAGRRFNVDDDRRMIGKPTDRGRWGMTPPTSDAYYNPLLNEIVFPAGILQPPAFDADASDAVDYGAIGVVIGHEISHGFDDQGAQFDAAGRLENWWTDEDLKSFQTRGQCVIEPTIHHKGKLVLGESIGDLGGVRIAYLAFQRAQAKHPEPAPAGLTPDQAFFIAWGQFRGDAIRPETQRSMVQGDPHPIAKYRVIGPLSNVPEFAQAFACKAGAPMVRPPEKRCEVW